MYWCISGELWLEAAPQPPEPALSEQPSEEASSHMDTIGVAGNRGGAQGPLSAPPPSAGPTGSRLTLGALSGLSLALLPSTGSHGNAGSDDGSSVGRGWPGSSRRPPGGGGGGGKGAFGGFGGSGLQLGHKMETEDGLFVAGRHQQQRGSFRQQRGDLQEQRDEEDQYGEQEQLPLQLHLLPPSMQLQLVSLGDSFHSAMLCEAATAGLQQPDGNAEDGSETVLSLPPPPVGTSVLRARAAEGDGAEVLSMSKPMLELLVGGMGRSMAPEAFQALARHVEWLAAVDLRVSGGVLVPVKARKSVRVVGPVLEFASAASACMLHNTHAVGLSRVDGALGCSGCLVLACLIAELMPFPSVAGPDPGAGGALQDGGAPAGECAGYRSAIAPAQDQATASKRQSCPSVLLAIMTPLPAHHDYAALPCVRPAGCALARLRLQPHVPPWPP